jgi:DmsE family decaheme c-type cytochrome
MQLTKSHLALAATIIALSVAAAAAQSPTEKPKLLVATEEAAKAPPLEVSACQACHETALSKPFLKSYHAGLENSCASCHKGAAEHSEAMQAGKEGVPAPSLTKLKAAEVNMVCLTCHEKGKQANWHGGVHERRGLSCISCHAVHNYQSEQHQLKTAADPATCYTCHASVRAKTLRTSHHPIREGLMTCGACHNPHDSTTPKMISASDVNEKCLECHTEKRGPFLWEHAPVRENCLNCHDPHGTNHDRMLIAKTPYLCQRCHLNTRHPGSLYDGQNTVGGGQLSNRAVEHSCRNCHVNVHGSNAPSGAYLGR